MATHLVTGYAGSEHIKSEDQGSFNASFFGTGQFVMEAGNQLEASIIDNNTVRILNGDILMKGRHIRINPNTHEDMIIENGTAGVNRCDLIVMEYSKDPTTGIETAALKVLKGTESSGTATAPAYTDGDILTGATLNQMPLYNVLIEGVVLVDVVCLFDTIPTYKTLAEMYKKEFIKACESHLNSLGILDTMEEINANTQDNQLAGANAVKELDEFIKKLNRTAIIYDTDTKEEALKKLDNPTLLDFVGNNTSWYGFIFNDCVGDSVLGGGQHAIIGYIYEDYQYGFQMSFSFYNNYIRRRHLNAGKWTDWEYDALNSELARYLPLSSIVDDLTSADTNKPLSANMGRALKSQIGAIRYKSLSMDITAEGASHIQCIKDNWESLNKSSTYLLKVTVGSERLALVQKYSSHEYGSVLLYGYGNNPKFYSLTSGTWSESTLATLADVLTRLPLSGGTLSGNLTIKNSYAFTMFENDARKCSIYLPADGVFGLYDDTNEKWILYSDKIGGSVTIPSILYANSMYAGGSKVLTAADFAVTGSTDDAKLTINLD